MAYYNPAFAQMTFPSQQQNQNYTMQQPMYTQMQQPQDNSGIIWVQGESGAKSFAVAPGRSVMLMDSEQSRFYIKTADASGMPMPLRIFTYHEEPAQTSQINTQEQPKNGYVTREEFESFVERVEAMTKKQNTNKREKRNESTVQHP